MKIPTKKSDHRNERKKEKDEIEHRQVIDKEKFENKKNQKKKRRKNSANTQTASKTSKSLENSES